MVVSVVEFLIVLVWEIPLIYIENTVLWNISFTEIKVTGLLFKITMIWPNCAAIISNLVLKFSSPYSHFYILFRQRKVFCQRNLVKLLYSIQYRAVNDRTAGSWTYKSYEKSNNQGKKTNDRLKLKKSKKTKNLYLHHNTFYKAQNNICWACYFFHQT